mgnify:CR=1 FL=1
MANPNVALTVRALVFFIVLSILSGCGSSGGSSGSTDDDDDDNNDGAPEISTASSLDLGIAVVNSYSTRQLTISNTGDENLIIGQITFEDSGAEWQILNDTCSTSTVDPDGSCTLQIRLSPADQDDYTNTLSIPSNDSSNNPEEVSLTGTGRNYGVHINSVICGGLGRQVLVTVTNSSGATVNTLPLVTPSTVFTVTENGSAKDIDSISHPDATVPVSIALMLDYSGSIVPDDMQAMEDASKDFLDLLDLAPAPYETAIVKFASYIGYQYDFSSDLDDLKDAIDADYNEGTSNTVIFDSVYSTIDYVADHAANDRKAIILFSDGEDYSLTYTLPVVIDRALEKGVPIFTILSTGADNPNPGVMQELAEGTGGQYYEAGYEDLDDIYNQISAALGDQYILEYDDPSGSSVTLRVSVSNLGSLGEATKVVAGCD